MNRQRETNQVNQLFDDMFKKMSAHYGPTQWWPGDTPFEVAIGAILTQNTAWTNVEKAILNLKRSGLLEPRRLRAARIEDVQHAVRPSGYFRQKTERLRIFCDFLLERYHGSMARMARTPLAPLRVDLLALKGIGPETADDILLYACEKPIFVVDAYTRRILSRHAVVDEHIGYDGLQQLFHFHVPPDVFRYKEFHGLIVWTAKEFCRRTPCCETCPLRFWGETERRFHSHQ